MPVKKDRLILGVDFTELNLDNIENKDLYNKCEGLMFYDNGKLTDKHYIQQVSVWYNGAFRTSGEVDMFIFGGINKGDKIMTCPFKGAGIACYDQTQFAVAEALEDRQPVTNEEFLMIGKIHAKLL
jgi:hypothetical protein